MFLSTPPTLPGAKVPTEQTMLLGLNTATGFLHQDVQSELSSSNVRICAQAGIFVTR